MHNLPWIDSYFNGYTVVFLIRISSSSVRPNTISILFLFIKGSLNVASFQNGATLVDILKVQKHEVSRILLQHYSPYF